MTRQIDKDSLVRQTRYIGQKTYSFFSGYQIDVAYIQSQAPHVTAKNHATKRAIQRGPIHMAHTLFGNYLF
jgi:hypothetical protein